MLTEREKLLFLMCMRRKKHIEAIIKYMKTRKQEKRFYIHPLNAARKKLGCFAILFTELEKYEIKFKEYFRLVHCNIVYL